MSRAKATLNMVGLPGFDYISGFFMSASQGSAKDSSIAHRWITVPWPGSDNLGGHF